MSKVSSKSKSGVNSERRRKRLGLQAPLEVTDPLASELRPGLKQRAMTAALCMLKGKSSRQLRPVLIPPPSKPPKRKLESVESRNIKQCNTKKRKKQSPKLEQTVDGPPAPQRLKLECLSADFLSSSSKSVISVSSEGFSWDEGGKQEEYGKLDLFETEEDLFSSETGDCPLGSLISGLNQPDDGLSSFSCSSDQQQDWNIDTFVHLM